MEAVRRKWGATIDSLREWLKAGGRVPVLVDGGFRRGTVSSKRWHSARRRVHRRPYIWGLAAFGQAGVEAGLDILQRELATIMRQKARRRC